MKRLEIIHLRLSAEPLEPLAGRIRESIRAEGEGAEVVTVFRRHGLDTDLAVHVLDAAPAGGQGSGELALRLASALRAYGLVEHTLWEELE